MAEAMYIPSSLIVKDNLTVGGTMPTTPQSSIDQDVLAAYMLPFHSWRKWNAPAASLDTLANPAGIGITGTAAEWATSVETIGSIIKTTMLIDLTGLNSGGTVNDIIGADGAGVAHLGQITTAVNGTIMGGKMTCLETPATGDDDIDVYSATEATGVEDTLVTDLTQTQLCNSGDLTVGSEVMLTAPAANQYIYLAGGTSGDATYTAGRLLLEFWGTSARDDLGVAGNVFATGSPAMETRDVRAEGAVTFYARTQFQMPPEFDDAQTVKIRAHCEMVTTVADTTATIDFQVFEADSEAGIGSDLCVSAAQTMNSLTGADKDFTITSTGLVSGDWLDIRMAVAINDASTAAVVKGRVGYVAILADIRG